MVFLSINKSAANVFASISNLSTEKNVFLRRKGVFA
ncbi:hypothetical protein BASH2_02108 [Bacillus anthracis]|nr:hypothetical protein BASH2_02108 [Bacillus anthracis]